MYDYYGRPLEATQIADKMLEKASKIGLWETVEMVVNVWFKKHPKEFEEHKKFVSLYRENLKNEDGSSKTGKARSLSISTGIRHMGEIPGDIATTLDMLCYSRIKEYGDKRFYREFFKRYPVFAVGRPE